MSRYIIESPHTKQECLKALDEILAKGQDILQKFEWGCAVGDHTGYAIVEAESEAKARGLLPESQKGRSRVVQVSRFTPDQIRSLHKAA